MKFELGKYYRHTSGRKLYICGLAETNTYDRCFVGEDEKGNLSPVGNTEENAINHVQITKEEFLNN